MRRAKSCTTSSDDDAPSVRPAFEPPSSSTLPARLPQAPLQPTQAPATIRLAFECKVETKWGDTAVLVGGADKLGAWSPDRGVPMFTDESCYPVWKADVSLLCASDELEYKIVILRGDGKGPEWEPLQNNRKLARAKARSVACVRRGACRAPTSSHKRRAGPRRRHRRPSRLSAQHRRKSRLLPLPHPLQRRWARGRSARAAPSPLPPPERVSTIDVHRPSRRRYSKPAALPLCARKGAGAAARPRARRAS